MFLLKRKPLGAFIIAVIFCFLFSSCTSTGLSTEKQFENESLNKVIHSQGMGKAIGLPDDQAYAFDTSSVFLYQYTEKFVGQNIKLISEYYQKKVEISDLEKELYTQVTLCDERFTDFFSVELLSDLKEEVTYWDLCYPTGKKNEFAHVIISSDSHKVVGYIFPWRYEDQSVKSDDEK